MTYNWSITEQTPIPQDVLDLALGDTLLARLLLNRGIDTHAEALYYLDIQSVKLSNPYEIPEMDKAFTRIKSAITKEEKILIFGDYDVDGTSSVALLYRAFGMIGYPVEYYIPSRHHEGYGLNKEAVRIIREEKNADLMITCDCGISNYDEVKYAQSLGLDVIVTDHHSIPANPPPSVANCNPKTLAAKHPLHYLPGVGVAYKLAELIIYDHFPEAEAKAYTRSLLDLVALGMVADLAPLRAENRYLTIIGLKELAKTSKPGLIELLQISRVHNNPNAEHIGFGLAPRINAAGRLADASRAVRLMITEDFAEARQLCMELDADNVSRQKLCEEVFNEAVMMIENNPSMLEDNVIVLASNTWHHGVIGIVASRLLDRFHLPVFLIAIEDNKARGSVRCIDVDGLNIYDEMNLVQAQTGLFTKFGGHKMAAGFSVDVNKISELSKALRIHFASRLADTNLNKKIKIDAALRLKELNTRLIDRLAKLAPYGIEHPQALFVSGPLQIKSMRAIGKDGKHLKLYLTDKSMAGKFYEALIWNRAEEFSTKYANKSEITIVYSPKLAEFQGELSIQLDIKDWKDPTEVDPKFFGRFQTPVSV